jgi:hypothetical protein
MSVRVNFKLRSKLEFVSRTLSAKTHFKHIYTLVLDTFFLNPYRFLRKPLELTVAEIKNEQQPPHSTHGPGHLFRVLRAPAG